MEDNRKLIATIPENVRLATQQNLAPHVSHRQYIYLVWPRQHDFDDNRCGQRLCWWLDFDNNADYLLVDLHPNQWLTQLLETNENFGLAVQNMEKAGRITIEKSINDVRLYRVH